MDDIVAPVKEDNFASLYHLLSLSISLSLVSFYSASSSLFVFVCLFVNPPFKEINDFSKIICTAMIVLTLKQSAHPH